MTNKLHWSNIPFNKVANSRSASKIGKERNYWRGKQHVSRFLKKKWEKKEIIDKENYTHVNV